MASSDDSAYGPRAGLLAPLPLAERGYAVITSASPDGRYVLYCNGTNVIIRDLERPERLVVYADHAHATKAAKFAPTGKYIASGDASGKVRVWAWTNAEHTLKYECAALGGEVEDVAWDGESKRIAAVGGGASKAKVFSWDTGSNLGEIIPHSKKIISVDLRAARPVRLVFGSEDFHASFYGGPPFKYVCGLKEHTNFVNCVRFSPDGARFVTVSSDKSGIVYAGETAAPVGKLDPAGMHAGGVYACAWAPAGSPAALVTAGGDKAVKLWDMSGDGPLFPCIATAVLGTRPDDMQQGVMWAPGTTHGGRGTIISTSLEGTLNYFDPNALPAGPTRRVVGHQAPAQVLDIDVESGLIFTGCTGGKVMTWRPTTGDAASAASNAAAVYAATPCTGEVPTKRIASIAVAGGRVAIAAWDDKLRVGDAASGVLATSVALGAQPKGVAGSPDCPGVFIVATGAAVCVVRDGALAATLPAAWGPTCVAAATRVSASGALVVAVGGSDKRVHVYSLAGGAGGALTEVGSSKEASAAVSAVAVSPCGTKIASGDTGREVRLWDASSFEALISGRWMAHTTRITGLRFSPSGARLASVSSDRRLCVWDPSPADAPRVTIDLAHAQPFAAVAWASETTLWTLGVDGIAQRREV